jgi:TetR/AcrR family transcriptional regulator, acrAB operon repressor
MRRTAEAAAANQAELLDAVLAVVVRQGYAATRLDDVAAHAGVTRGALYHHFKNKAELFNAAVAARWAELAGEVFQALDEPGAPLPRIERFLAAYVHRIRTEPRFRELIEVVLLPLPELDAGRADKQQAVDGWRDALMPLLEEAREDLHTTPEAAAEIILTALYGATLHQADGLAEAIVRGIRR